MQEPTSRLIYEDEEVRIIARSGRGDLLLVTFADLVSLAEGLKFFGDAPAAKVGLPVVGIVAKRPAWYPRASVLRAINAIDDHLAPYTQRMIYGGSMGGYAALKFSGALKATQVLAFCPQWSIDPKECGGVESGYSNFFTPDLAGMGVQARDVQGTAYIFADLGDPVDRFHCRAISAVAPAIRIINTPMIGHAVTGVFAGTGNLQDLMQAVLVDDRRMARTLAHRIRKAHPVRAQTLMARAYPRHSKLCLSPLLERAQEQPTLLTAEPRFIYDAVASLLEQARPREALQLLDKVRAIQTTPAAQLRTALVGAQLLGAEIVLETYHGTRVLYGTAQDACHHGCAPGASHDLPVRLDLGARSVNLFVEASSNRLRLSLDGLGLIGLGAQRPHEADEFEIEASAPGVFHLRSNGRYLTAEPGGRLVCNRSLASGWEQFHFGLIAGCPSDSE